RLTPRVYRVRRSVSFAIGLLVVLLAGWARAQSPSTVNSTAASQQAVPAPPMNQNASQGIPQDVKTEYQTETGLGNTAVTRPLPALPVSIWEKRGVTVTGIDFRGVVPARARTVSRTLEQKVGQPLDPDKVRADLRSLFASGEYMDIAVY